MERDFTLVVIGDFSGAGSGEAGRLLDVDRDAFEAVFARLAPRMRLDLPFCDALALGDWEQWRPDGLVGGVPGLARLKQARESARDPERMREHIAAAGVSVEVPSEAAPERPAEPEAPAPTPTGSGAELLDDLLASPGAKGPAGSPSGGADPTLDALLHEIASPHAERIDHAGIAARQAAVDRALGERLRALLHHPAFQRREALWRSLRTLVFGAETGEGLRIRILDADLEALRSPRAKLAQALRERLEEEARGVEGGRAFDLLVFEASVDGTREGDLELLGGLAGLAAATRARGLLEAGPGLWGRGPGAAGFVEAARGLAGAEGLGLCAPGLLLRLPYGKASDPVDGFPFEEVPDGGEPSDYLWGGTGFELARAVCEAVAETRSASETRQFVRREGLPFHPQGPGGEPAGPTRVLFTEREVEQLRDLGVLPLAGIRGRDAALITSLSSLTGRPLFGG